MKTSWMSCLPVPLLALVLAGCGVTNESELLGAIRLSVSPRTASTSDTLHLSLTNFSLTSAGYNLCHVGLQRRVGDAWVRSTWGSDRVCTMELRGLRPGQSATGRVALDGSVLPGTYRIVTSLEWPLGGGQRQVFSEQFSVRPESL